MVTKITNKRALVAFIVVLVSFLFIADFLVITSQRQHLLERYEHHSSHELELLGNAISASLTRNDYADVERFINEWGSRYWEIIEIEIVTSNNFILASYDRPEFISAHILPLKKDFTYGNDKTFTIRIIKDSSLIYDDIKKLSNRLILSSILFVFFLGILMWKTLNVTAIVPLQNEIQQRKKTEQQLKIARDKAIDASKHKSEFLANMSHELRTPLNSIIGFTSIVKDGIAGPVNEEQAHQLAMVYNSANHLLGLINSVLDLAKVEAGEVESVKTYFNLHAFLEELVTTLKPLAEKKDLRFDINVDCIKEEIYTDRSMLSQILMNLLSNAIKFTEQGSITLDCRHDKNNLVIKVIDTGIGISQKFIDQVFDAFKQEDSSFTRKYEGTGLGLSISQHFSLLLGGQLEVESSKGEGSTFTLVVPVTEE